jgi:photoactive yellow protein
MVSPPGSTEMNSHLRTVMSVRIGSGDRSRKRGGHAIGSTVCVWCQKVLVERSPDAPVSHGICLGCMVSEHPFPHETIETMSHDQLNLLPFGVIRLEPDGTIIDYNDAESKMSHRCAGDVLGKNFFTEVAPCTQVAEFQGKFLELQKVDKDGRAEFSFVFRFATGAALVDVVLLHEAHAGHETILVKVLSMETHNGNQQQA